MRAELLVITARFFTRLDVRSHRHRMSPLAISFNSKNRAFVLDPTSLAAGVPGAPSPLFPREACGHHLLSVLWNRCLPLAIAGGVRSRAAVALIIAGLA